MLWRALCPPILRIINEKLAKIQRMRYKACGDVVAKLMAVCGVGLVA